MFKSSSLWFFSSFSCLWIRCNLIYITINNIFILQINWIKIFSTFYFNMIFFDIFNNYFSIFNYTLWHYIISLTYIYLKTRINSLDKLYNKANILFGPDFRRLYFLPPHILEGSQNMVIYLHWNNNSVLLVNIYETYVWA